MKTIRKAWPKVREYVKHGKTYYHVDLRRRNYVGKKFQNFTTRDTALEFATTTAKNVLQQGIGILESGINEKVRIWNEQCVMFNKSIDDAIRVATGVWESERKVQESPYVAELLTLWVDDKEGDTLEGLRERTLKGIRTMSYRFKNDFGMMRLKELTNEKLREYLNELDVANQTKKNIRSYLGQFFNYCKVKGHTTINPVEGIDIKVIRTTPDFLT